MGSLQILFTGYAIIGLTLLILAASVAIYLLSLPSKSRATWALAIFFFMVALSGAAMVLTNAVNGWGDFFAPWQDFFILAGGVALTIFAYSLPRHETPREARAALLLISSLALAALVYTMTFDYRFLFHLTPELNESDLYYLLLPVGILLTVITFLRRSMQFSKSAGSNKSSLWRRVIHPQDEDARALRSLALALSLAFLPAIQTLVSLPYPYGFIMTNIGSILAIIAIALVYFNYAPEVNSFLAKLVGITLAFVLLIVAVAGSIDVYIASDLTNEIAASDAAAAQYISAIVSRWLVLILAASAFVLLFFPLFFRRVLIEPILYLVHGIKEVNQGNLNTFVPIRFDDEIGSLTDSFNKLTQSLKVSKIQQEELYHRLQVSYEELEERVADRTRELSAFTDLTMLPGDYENLTDILQPALNRIMEIGLCQALCVHLLAEDQHAMVLFAQRNLPEMVIKRLEIVPASPFFTSHIQRVNDPFLAGSQIDQSDLPPQLPIEAYQSYVGSPLVVEDQVLGWLSCYRRSENDFTIGEVSLLVALARQLGIIVENQRLRQQIKDIAVFEERQRLARDLHDSVTQLLYGMTLFSRSAEEALQDGDQTRLERNIKNLSDTALHALREMRFLLFELQPPLPKELGLARALEARLDMVENRVGIAVDFDIDGKLLKGEQLVQDLYYVAIESLNNVIKHAGADHVKLSIQGQNGSVCLVVSDNGQGFDTEQIVEGLGLKGMKHRVDNLGGELIVDSRPGRGTKITAVVPNGEHNE